MPDRSDDVRSQGVEWTSQLRPPTSEFDPTQGRLVLSSRRPSVGRRAMSDGHRQLEGGAAELYQRYLVPPITTRWAEDLVDRTLVRSGELVLDVACGTGVDLGS